MIVNDPRIEYHGPTALHCQPCAIHHDEHAVLDMDSGVFIPGWKAQSEGWVLLKLHDWQIFTLKLIGWIKE